MDRVNKTRIFCLLLVMTMASGAFAASPENVSPKDRLYSQRGRLIQINVWLAEGSLGENSEGLLVVRGKSRNSLEQAVKDENAEREKMFKTLSQKKGTTVMAQKVLYAQKRRKEIPKGSPVQEADGTWGVKV